MKQKAFKIFLQNIVSDIPKDAVGLRAQSYIIISSWIKNKFNYPHDLIDPFVYIESSIEGTIEENFQDAVKLDFECKDSYNFHVKNFTDSVNALIKFTDDL